MEILRDMRIADLALVYKDTMIIGDLQLGYEEALEREGVLVPRFQLKDVIERMDGIFEIADVRRIVINGDLKHEFGKISNQEWRDALRFFDYLFEHVDEIILIRGNHDIVLDPVAEKRNIKVVDSYTIGDVVITHGHKIIPNLGKIIVIGHEHPAISFKERKNEKFKCFLVGKWKGKTLIVQPSFNLLTAGSDVTNEGFLSPFLKDGVDNFEVYVVEDGVRYFGKVRDVRKV